MPEGRIKRKLTTQIDRAAAELDRLRTLLVYSRSEAVLEDITAGLVRSVLQARRRREAIFEGGLFADPAWDVLLHTYAAQLDEDQVTVADVSRDTGLPNTTVLRWVERLERLGLLHRSRDVGDQRRSFITLSGIGTAAMERYFLEREPSGAPV